MRIPLAFADSTQSLRIPPTVAGSATAQFNYIHVLLFVCGFHKLFWIPQIRLRIPHFRLFPEQFWAVQSFRYLFAESKAAKNIKEKKQCCGFRKISDFGLLLSSFTMHKMHILVSYWFHVVKMKQFCEVKKTEIQWLNVQTKSEVLHENHIEN